MTDRTISPDKAISPLRRRMIEDMAIRRFAAKTQQIYVQKVKEFAAFLGRSPDTARSEDVRAFRLHLISSGAGTSKTNGTVAALRFFLQVTLDRPDLTKHLTFVRKPHKAPVVLSPEEVARFLEAAPGVKYKAALGVAYGAGLRVSEVASLKVSDIDSTRMMLRVEQGKGRKDRYAMLSPVLLGLLRDWYRLARPQGWLFPGQNPVRPMTTRQLARVCHTAAHAAGITKRVSPHTLRHSFATHLLEQNVDIRVIQVLLGHAQLDTTALYTRVATQWLAEREADLLPVAYYHIVFTLPAPIGDIACQNKAEIYDVLFKASAETLTTIAADPKHLGARVGITSVLHSWGSALTHHPHIQMIVPGGGISLDRTHWVSCRPGFFLPVRVLSRLFRRLFLERLLAAHATGRLTFFGAHAALADPHAFAAHLAPLRKTEWVVYAKKPFGGPQAVLAYLSRYTHRVAIANSRLVAYDRNGVTFRWKDYRLDGRERFKTMTLATFEFIRRFLIHVLPSGFHRIRHYGLFASGSRSDNIARARDLLPAQPPPHPRQEALTDAGEPKILARPCPCCGGRMIVIERFPRGSTPRHWPPVPTPVFRIDSS